VLTREGTHADLGELDMYQAVGDCKHGQQKEEQNEHNTSSKPKEAQPCASPTVTEGDLALQEVL